MLIIMTLHVNKDDSSSVGELFQNRKRHLPNADANDPRMPPIKMCLKILGQVVNEFSVLDEEGPSVDPESANKIVETQNCRK